MPECPICLEELDYYDEDTCCVIYNPLSDRSCGHPFHCDCLDDMIGEFDYTCPLCRFKGNTLMSFLDYIEDSEDSEDSEDQRGGKGIVKIIKKIVKEELDRLSQQI